MPQAVERADDGADAPGVVLPQPDKAGEAPVARQAVPAVPAAPAPVTAGPSLPEWVLDGRLKRRPSEMGGFTRNVAAPEGKVNITINSDEEGPLELFINIGRAGSDVAALAEALGRLISLQLRLPSTMSQEERLRQVANQLKGIGGSRSIGFGVNRVLSLPDAVAQAIYRHLEEHPTPPKRGEIVPATQLALPVDTIPTSFTPAPMPTASTAAHTVSATIPQQATTAQAGHSMNNGHGASSGGGTLAAAAMLTGNLCPQCGSSGAYVFEEGCKKCHYCGYSEC